jgi:hypothetical protein
VAGKHVRQAALSVRCTDTAPVLTAVCEAGGTTKAAAAW